MVSETGTNTQTGTLQFNVFDSNGNTTPVLEIGEEGMTVSGGINVVGGNTTFETSTIEVADRDIVLASGATTNTDLDGGGVIIGNDTSGTVELTYNADTNMWDSTVGLNIQSGHSLTIGTDGAILSESGLEIGDVNLSSDGLTLSTDVSLDEQGLTIGDISLTTNDGLAIGNDISLNTSGMTLGSTNPVVIDTGGISIGTDLSLNTTTGLMIGSDLSLTPSGGLEIGSDISLTSTGGLEINDISLTTSGLNIAGTDPISLDSSGLTFFTKTGGLSLGTGSSLTSDSISFGTTDPTVIDDTSVSLGSDVLLNHDGLFLTNNDAAVFLGGTTWKIAYDSTTQNLLFQFFDSVSGTYVTKTEIKNSS